MATDHDHGHYAHHPDVSYERTDLGHRGIWAFFAFLAISGIVIFIAVGALYKGFGYAQSKLATTPGPMAQSNAAKTDDPMMNTSMVNLQKFSANGTQPLLQSNDVVDMDTFLKEEQTLLHAAPWKDDKGNVHLPIERAMELVSQRSLPARAQAADPAAPNPQVVPAEQGFAGFQAVQQSADATNAEGAAETMKEPVPNAYKPTPGAKGELGNGQQVPAKSPRKPF